MSPQFCRAVASLALAAGLAAAGCDGSATTDPAVGAPGDPGVFAPEPPDEPGPCPLKLTELAAYQTVKVPLARIDAAAVARSVDLVANKRVLLRAGYSALDAGRGRTVRARLTLTASGHSRIIDQTRTINGDSFDGALDSTFNFELEPGEVREDATVRLETAGFEGCRTSAQARLAPVALAPRRTGVLRIWLQPLSYDTDGSGRLPDLSPEQIARYRDLLMAMYPVESVDLVVRQPISATVDLTGGGWGRLLDSLRGRRATEGVPDDVYYYGLVSPADSFRAYCGSGCIEGISYLTDGARSALRVGVGIGFPGDESVNTVAHELAHQHGRRHAPCRVQDGDPDFPYDGGRIGVWGFDGRDGRVVDPANVRDIMGYCRPTWISDYTYQALLRHSLGINRPAALRLDTSHQAGWRVLLSDGQGNLSWGLPAGPELDAEAGTGSTAAVLGADGSVVTTIQVVRIPLADDRGAMYLVPRLPAIRSGHALAVPGLRAIGIEP